MKRVLELSKQDAHMKPANPVPVADEDPEMQRALAMSI